MSESTANYTTDAVVVGAGHAGIEAGLALARLGLRVTVLSITLDNIGYCACNPSIGGSAKGHLVREIDALGGEMGVAADTCAVQMRMLNTSKGPAVHALRAQVDKYEYHKYMKRTLENQENLTLRQGEVKRILVENGRACGIETVYGQTINARAVVLACGVYLKSDIIVGSVIEPKGPVCFCRANHLSQSLIEDCGINLRRFKTGTPARINADTVDFSALEVQEGEETPYSFSLSVKKVNKKGRVCYLGYTNERTHELIRENLSQSPKYGGLIHGTGARYCPSIEDKIVRFADKERHQFFLEPEGDGTKEMYVQGISTSLPASVQLPLYRTIRGFEHVEIMRDAYAIEYDCIDPTELYPTLAHKRIEGLFFAGQINGTSGYEEAAAQGLVAGINAARFVKGESGVVFSRKNSYIGVMIDDLVTKGTEEPYRMLSARSEHRLLLRQDNADLRLGDLGIEIGLLTGKRKAAYKKLKKEIAAAAEMLGMIIVPASLIAESGEGEPLGGNEKMKLGDAIRRGLSFEAAYAHMGGVSKLAAFEAVTNVRYEGYVARENRAVREAQRLEEMALPTDVDYRTVGGLRTEGAERLNAVKDVLEELGKTQAVPVGFDG
ncbi:MAG: tRNA uridine-5-carboxymethylaminomethyl(34) synthesis enzyme MnmG, partial [Clostridiales bacterium]|nr:tRNA uridine-5-carboxymethylaminomethyl(34) synthesis enzyme MnmG [Clostridiales bacterium]